MTQLVCIHGMLSGYTCGHFACCLNFPLLFLCICRKKIPSMNFKMLRPLCGNVHNYILYHSDLQFGITKQSNRGILREDENLNTCGFSYILNWCQQNKLACILYTLLINRTPRRQIWAKPRCSTFICQSQFFFSGVCFQNCLQTVGMIVTHPFAFL